MRIQSIGWLLGLGWTAVSLAIPEPTLRSGDIVFQTSSSKQSYAILWASKSRFSHVGIVEIDGDKKYVLEAISKVSRTPLKKWIARGRGERYAVYRHPSVTEEKGKEIVKAAKSYLGRGYDPYFTSGNSEIYCSELVDLAYRQAGLPVGQRQKVKELDVDNLVVKKLAQSRWKRHPVCKGERSFDNCWKKILDDELVTPESVAADPQLAGVWSNYPMPR